MMRRKLLELDTMGCLIAAVMMNYLGVETLIIGLIQNTLMVIFVLFLGWCYPTPSGNKYLDRPYKAQTLQLWDHNSKSRGQR